MLSVALSRPNHSWSTAGLGTVTDTDVRQQLPRLYDDYETTENYDTTYGAPTPHAYYKSKKQHEATHAQQHNEQSRDNIGDLAKEIPYHVNDGNDDGDDTSRQCLRLLLTQR